MIGYVLTFALFYALSKTKKRPSLGKLPGKRIKRSDLYKKIRNREAGDINNGDLYFDGGFVYDDNKTYYLNEEIKDAIEETLKNNQNHLRAEERPTNLLSYNDYFGFNKIEPLGDLEAFNFTVYAIKNGKKFIWENQGVRRGLESELFGTKAPGEKKAYKNIISKDGITIEELNENFSLDHDYRNAIINALMTVTSRKEAKDYLDNQYNEYVNEYIKENIIKVKIIEEEEKNRKQKLEKKAKRHLEAQKYKLPFIPDDEEDTPF